MHIIPYRPDLVEKAKCLRQNPSPVEVKFWCEILRHGELKAYRFTKQKPLLNYIIDFYCPVLRIAIEIDGDSHFSQGDYDAIRTKELGEYSIDVWRYSNTDVCGSPEGVYLDLLDRIYRLRETPPTPSRGL